MEKSCHSSCDSTSNNSSSSSNYHQQHQHQNNNSSRDQYLKQLNKISHKISKDARPPPIRKYPLDLHQNQQQQQQQQQQQSQQQQQQQHQPPVYNINKNDFRDVVQKLTGSPAHERSFSTPPPIHPPKPPSSRLQRIRPPPLAHLSNRPPPPLANAILPPNTTATAAGAGGAANVATLANNAANINCTGNFVGNNNGRSVSPLSPLPPFPAHAAAESPISAYMRYLQNSMSTVDSESKRFSSGLSPLMPPRWNNPNSLQPLVSPRWNNINADPLQPPQPQPQLQQQQIVLPSPTAAMSPSQFLMPSSPLPFGKLPSPRSSYPLLSPTFLFSPTGGQLGFPQFPPSPRLSVASPRWRDL